MKKMKYFFIGLKNAFIGDVNEIKRDYPIYDLWEKSHQINEKFKAINERTKENIKKHIYPAY